MSAHFNQKTQREQQPPPYDIRDHAARDAELLFSTASTSTAGIRSLELPLCLPQTMSSFDAPFARAYSPDLAACGIQQEDWLNFLDELNIVMTASPPLRIADLAGYAMGFVPNPWTFMASIFLQTTSQANMHEVQKSHTDRLLEHANLTLFGPRGLKVMLMRTGAMRRFVGIDSVDAISGMANGFTIPSLQTIQDIPVIGRIAGRIANRVNGRAGGVAGRITERLHGPSAFNPTSPYSNTERRLAELQGYILPVSLDLPDPRAPGTTIERFLATADVSGHMPLVSSNQDNSGWRNAAASVMNHRQGRSKSIRREVTKGIAKAVNSGRGQGQHTMRPGRIAADDFDSTIEILWVVLFDTEHDTEIMGMQVVDTIQNEEVDEREELGRKNL